LQLWKDIKESDLAYLRHYLGIPLEGIRKTSSEEPFSRSPSRISKWTPSEYCFQVLQSVFNLLTFNFNCVIDSRYYYYYYYYYYYCCGCRPQWS